MGILINAKCNNCDYQKEDLTFGNGMQDHMFKNYDRCRYPALNPDKSDIVMIDINLKSGYEKSGYLFYDSEVLYDVSTKKDLSIIKDGEYIISIANYYCPKCKMFALSFHDCGCWD